MTDDAAISQALADVATIADAWTTALQADLDLAPRGIDYAPRATTITSDDARTDERLGPITIDGATGQIRTSTLHRCYQTSVTAMRAARSHLTAAYGPLPTHLIDGVTTGLRTALTRHRTWPEDTHTAAAIDLIDAALDAMPTRTWRTAPDGHHATPDLKRCAGGPGRRGDCPEYIRWDADPGYCMSCRDRFEALLDHHPGHRGDPCRNPWQRPHCRGRVDVPATSLCRPCENFRLRVIQQSTPDPTFGECVDCGGLVQDRGSRCWACRKARQRAAS